MSCDHELANEKTRCSGKNASYITIQIILSGIAYPRAWGRSLGPWYSGRFPACLTSLGVDIAWSTTCFIMHHNPTNWKWLWFRSLRSWHWKTSSWPGTRLNKQVKWIIIMTACVERIYTFDGQIKQALLFSIFPFFMLVAIAFPNFLLELPWLNRNKKHIFLFLTGWSAA